MLLTGKALRDFYKFIFEKHKLQPYNVSNEIFLNALTIDWLDSVNIKILPCHGLSGWYCELKIYNNKEFGNYKCFLIVKKNTNDFDTRPEATQQAILKANEIYNNLNTKKDEK